MPRACAVLYLALSACAATPDSHPPPPARPPTVAATTPPVFVPTDAPAKVPPSAFATRLDALEQWLASQPAIERVASWGNGDRFVWVRDDAGSTWCWQPDSATRKAVPTAGRCWTETDRPELLSVLLATSWPPRLRLAWGPENGRLGVWEFDPVAGQRQRLGEVIARSREPLPFWWAPTQIELSEPGKRWTMPATAPPDFMMLGLDPSGRPDPPTAWTAIATPSWLPLLDELEVWPYRSSTGAVAFSVAPARDSVELGVCAHLERWHCVPLPRPHRSVEDRAPVRAERLGPTAIALELAELDPLAHGDDTPDHALGTFFARAELHILDASVGQLAPAGALTLGGAVGTSSSLGMYRSTVDLDYRFVRRAYQPWSVAGRCLRIDALRGDEVALDAEFKPLNDLLVREWRRDLGRLPAPRKPAPLAPDVARAIVCETAILPPGEQVVDPATNPEGLSAIAGRKLVQVTPDRCGP